MNIVLKVRNGLQIDKSVVVSGFATSISPVSAYTNHLLPTAKSVVDYVHSTQTTVSAEIAAISAKTDSVYSTVESHSAGWETDLSGLSPSIFKDYTGQAQSQVSGLSAAIDSNFNLISEVSAKADSVYSTVMSNSASWSSGGTVTSGQLSAYLKRSDFDSYSSNVGSKLDSVYSTVQSNSASWGIASSGYWSRVSGVLTPTNSSDSIMLTAGQQSADIRFNSISFINESVSAGASLSPGNLSLNDDTVNSWLYAYGYGALSMHSTNSALTAENSIDFFTSPLPGLEIFSAMSGISYQSLLTHNSFKIGSFNSVNHVIFEVASGGDVTVMDNRFTDIVSGIVDNDKLPTQGYVDDAVSASVSGAFRWNSVFATVLANSAEWSLTGGATGAFITHSEFVNYTAGVNAVIQPITAQLASVYSTVLANSAAWASGGTVTSGQLSAYLKKADFESYSGQIAVELGSVFSTVESGSGKWNSVFSTVVANSAEWALSGSSGTVTSGQLSAYLKKTDFNSYSGQVAVEQHYQDLAITGKVSITDYSYMYIVSEPTGGHYPGVKGQRYYNPVSGIMYDCVATDTWIRMFGARTW